MEMDLTKLGKLIEKCSEAGVRKLKLGELEVDFDAKDDEESVTQIPVHPLDERVKIITSNEESSLRGEEDKDFEDEMLHLTDPAAWQRRMLDPENDEDSVAVGGDEESELIYEH
jgi:hypothetical protein